MISTVYIIIGGLLILVSSVIVLYLDLTAVKRRSIKYGNRV